MRNLKGDLRGVTPLIVIVAVMVSVIGVIVVYSTMAEPIQEFKNTIKDKMDGHTDPIDLFWTIFKAGGIILLGAILLWGYLKMQEDEYERERVRRRY